MYNWESLQQTFAAALKLNRIEAQSHLTDLVDEREQLDFSEAFPILPTQYIC